MSHIGVILSAYKCYMCSKSYSCRNTLANHMRIHTRGKSLQSYNCYFCNKSYSCKSTFVNHLLKHTVEEPCQCSQCDKAFSTRVGLPSYLPKHTGDRPYTCNMCNKSYSQKCGLTNHKRIHTSENLYKCNHCNETFLSNSDRLFHMQVHSKRKSRQCIHCGKIFLCNDDLIIHRKYSCGKLSTHRKHLNKHSGAQLGTNQYENNKSDESLAKQDSPGKLSKRPTIEELYQCEQCKKCYLKEHNLANHMKVHSVNKNAEDYQSKQCHIILKAKDASTTNTSTVDDKALIHIPENLYKCNYCNETFLSNSDWLFHMQLHKFGNTNDRPRCIKCRKFFLCNDDLIIHRKNICDKPSTLTKHLNKHSGVHLLTKQIENNKFGEALAIEELYQCEQCKKCYLEEHSLANHMKVHSVNKDVEDYQSNQNHTTLKVKDTISSTIKIPTPVNHMKVNSDNKNVGEYQINQCHITLKAKDTNSSTIKIPTLEDKALTTSMMINGIIFRIKPKNDLSNNKQCDSKGQEHKTRILVGTGSNSFRETVNTNGFNSASTSKRICDNVIEKCENGAITFKISKTHSDNLQTNTEPVTIRLKTTSNIINTNFPQDNTSRNIIEESNPNLNICLYDSKESKSEQTNKSDTLIEAKLEIKKEHGDCDQNDTSICSDIKVEIKDEPIDSGKINVKT